MHFQDLTYWQDKAKNIHIETRLFINGEYCDAADNSTFDTLDPAAQKTLAQVARGKQADVDRAVEAARAVFDRGDWSQASPARRKAVLNSLADLIERDRETLALLETLDTGKPVRHSLRDDIPGAARAIRWYAEAADKVYGEVAPTGNNDLAMIVREPVGVVAAIVPWNFPLLLACWKLGPALVAGNSVILKPSEKSPLTAIRLAALAKEAGLPDGVLNVISGFGHEAGQALALHPDVEVMTFTGSTRTGKQLLKDAGDSNMKRVWLEAGGKSANIVFADCPDLDKAVSTTAAGIFYNQGQVCIAGTRLLLEESIADAFLSRLKAEAQNWQPGNPLDPDTTMGTLIDAGHADAVHGFIRDGMNNGTLLLDGRNSAWPAAVGPTLFVDVKPEAAICREEIFGPVLVVTRFKTEEEALRLANDSQYGLGAAVWTRDLSRAHRMSRRLKAGSVFVNNYNDGDMTVPFGGYKQSGNGRDKSLHALEKFTELKTIWIALEP
ncbi:MULTISPECIES: aldehyde dehydrogenase PuuC [Enterobacter]|jgi:gamma-glutamyl-gamma-aminobutyraldehyde dehydrogenase|uniref:Aldehyde dehydrogenase PuuC n=1 Tax=Enterobacter cancerogenus TaxID=69218 RepID=A0A5Q2K494_9ENTR|nr:MULTISPECIES: aldehyde dehydrogenase PuuC [Enterobacter]KTQ48193.1 aldehyde dehydrogenase [Enterobacter cancerogenus]KTQ49698.1 aldehyde dehydrogenase [Enterobacter cancerogenus]KTQ73112.1 aldehyde dehydrogenase [Enterobacter cancerogenus]KTQ77851.1 aldehyde dehydrogenase [Enterobacter cancerogenus]MDI3426109.1 aldehyde dehydrogenase PuuC [Enterobacter sp. V87_3]